MAKVSPKNTTLFRHQTGNFLPLFVFCAFSPPVPANFARLLLSLSPEVLIPVVVVSVCSQSFSFSLILLLPPQGLSKKGETFAFFFFFTFVGVGRIAWVRESQDKSVPLFVVKRPLLLFEHHAKFPSSGHHLGSLRFVVPLFPLSPRHLIFLVVQGMKTIPFATCAGLSSS